MRPAALALVLLLAGCGSADPAPPAGAAKPQLSQLPGGGRTVFADPARRVVAFYGSPDDPELGTLGIGTPSQAARRLQRLSRRYATPTRGVLPALELLAAVATADPGPDGQYRRRASHATIRRYLRAARSIHALLVLDIQPGRADFLPEVQRLERWLSQPDVGLALDPEWHVGPGQVPAQVIGSVDAAEVVAVGDWLDALTARHRLPQKLLVVHEFTRGMVARRERLHPFRHVAVVVNADGFGTQTVKRAKYHAFSRRTPWAFNGFKLFFREDVGLMSPRQVLRMRPPPDVVVYE